MTRRPAADEEPANSKDAAHPSVLADWTRALAATAVGDKDPLLTLPGMVAIVARQTPDAPALVSDRECFTYGRLHARIDRYARWALGNGIQPGDTVALLMENRPEYIVIWLGLTKVGITVALLNTNLRGTALAHCVHAASAKAAIVSAPLVEAWETAQTHLAASLTVWLHGVDGAFPRVDTSVDALAAAQVVPLSSPPTRHDRALLIYTSGTTGLPKAANVSHGRVLSWSLWFAGMLGTGPADRMYDCLPLYHSVGGVVAVGALLARGGSVAIAPAFSASRFWSDIRRHECTLAQYIGELCRYLLASAPAMDETAHGLRAICGNGLRADVWERFQSRFAIPRIVEFYAASEGTFSLYNMEGEPGAIGRVPSFLRHRFPAALVCFDEATGKPARDAAGRCIRPEPGAVGEAIGRVPTRQTRAGAFEGYTDARATEAKLLFDVFTEGDCWVRTGDLMRIDARGFWYFVDRVGDTFRWKGENVATLEVAESLMTCAGVGEAIVFGVPVPHADGAAGMAVLTMTPTFSLDAFAAEMATKLPPYARPVFVRVTTTLETTGTFKHQTRALQSEGYDPRAVRDPVFMLDGKSGRYLPLDAALFDALGQGAVKL